MPRRQFSAKAKMARLLKYDGKCAGCGCKLGGAHGRIEWDHIDPIAMGGRDEIDNLQPLCVACHKAKTATDKKHIAKGKRMEQRAAGIGRTRKGRGFATNRDGAWKRKINGEVVRR